MCQLLWDLTAEDLGMIGREGAHRLVHDDEALLGELQAIVCLEAIDVAAAEGLLGAKFPDVIRQHVERAVRENHADLLVSH